MDVHITTIKVNLHLKYNTINIHDTVNVYKNNTP